MIHPVPKPKGKSKAAKARERNARRLARKRERRAANFLRAYGGEERLAWIKAWVCMLWRSAVSDCAGPIEAAHAQTGGMGRKADASALLALCQKHHQELHQQGARTFEWRYGLSLAECARRTDLAYQRHMEAARGD